MTNKLRVPLYDRLPEIYRTKDRELIEVPDQLKAYLALVEQAYGHIHENIEELYHDLFIETADDWVIPYIGDLLGTSPLSGDPWTLRADVADTIALRRRKGTLGAIELLAYNLTRWGAHCVELRENLLWNQHLNHQRPDEGGDPPFGQPTVKLETPIRGGTVNLRDPAELALLGTPFDRFAYTVDVKPASLGAIRYNLPNLAIFLWRLTAYRIEVTKPLVQFAGLSGQPAPLAAAVARFRINPLERPYLPAGNDKPKQPVKLFNTNRFGIENGLRQDAQDVDVIQLDLNSTTPRVSLLDEVPGPIPIDRLTEGEPNAAPEKYFSAETYDSANVDLAGVDPLDVSEVGLQLHLPVAEFANESWPPPAASPTWRIRGEDLCAWKDPLEPPLRDKEIAIDPVLGRVMIGVSTAARATALADRMLVTYTYAAVGPVGAHPVARVPTPDEFNIPETDPNFHIVKFRQNPNALQAALANLPTATSSDPQKPPVVVIEIRDSFTHVLDLSAVAGTLAEHGGLNLLLNGSLCIRAASNQRPIIKLKQPLRFRPAKVVGADEAEQKKLNSLMSEMTVRLEGLVFERAESSPTAALVARAAINALEIIECTLDPGGFRRIDGKRAPIQRSVSLKEPYGFSDPRDEDVFEQTPEIIVSRSITGPLFIDTGYALKLTDSIIDAGQGIGVKTTFALAIANATKPKKAWGPPAVFKGVTIFGRTRVESITGSGGIFVHALQARDQQRGCVKLSYLANEGGVPGKHADRLPQNYACVKGRSAIEAEVARLQFTSEFFGDPAYGQIGLASDFRIRERGPDDDQMGAFGFLLEAHKWRNLQIRFREFVPVGIRSLLIPVT